MKYINYKRYKFYTILKNINFKRYYFSKIYKFIGLATFNVKKIYKITDIRRIKSILSIKYLDYKKIKIPRIYKKINFSYINVFFLYILCFTLFCSFIYISVPFFYKYENIKLEKIICKNTKFTCKIMGKVNYTFYPTPRLNIRDLKIIDFLDKKNTLLDANKVSLKVSVVDLLKKDQPKLKQIEFKDYQVNIDNKNLKKYKNIFEKQNYNIPYFFENGKISFYNDNKYVATISDANLNFFNKVNLQEVKLTGNFLNNDIILNLSKAKIENKYQNELSFKSSDLNLLTKISFQNSIENQNILDANILLRKDKLKLSGIFDYKNNEILIKKSNLTTYFSDGKLDGVIKILPYFDFNLNINFNSLNVTKLYKYFLSLEEKKQKEFFKISEKINGKFNFSANKVYSSYNLVNAFESQLKLNNGNIIIEQFLLNLGKLGAADILGEIKNNKKYINFKYESNIYVDNQKKFLSKFGIYNKKKINPNIFVSGNFDLKNIKNSFYELSAVKKLPLEDVNFIENEFNDIILADGYKNLFNFPKFKEFVKIITTDTN